MRAFVFGRLVRKIQGSGKLLETNRTPLANLRDLLLRPPSIPILFLASNNESLKSRRSRERGINVVKLGKRRRRRTGGQFDVEGGEEVGQGDKKGAEPSSDGEESSDDDVL